VQRTTNELTDIAGGQNTQQTAVRLLISIANGQTVSRVLARVTATRLQAEIGVQLALPAQDALPPAPAEIALPAAPTRSTNPFSDEELE
jgi:hypothetical protein